MDRRLRIWLVALMLAAAAANTAERSTNDRWTEAQMNPRGKYTGGRQFIKIPDVRLLPDHQAFPDLFDCHEEKCKYDLFYFRGEGFNLGNPKRRNILFIAGGPGQAIPDSTTTDPPSRPPTCTPATVTTGSSTFLSTCRSVIWRSLRPVARAVATQSRPGCSSMVSRIRRA